MPETVTATIFDLHNTTIDANLFNGLAGITLYYAYLYKVYGAEIYLDEATDYLQKTLQASNEKASIDFSLGYGYAGIGWLVQELNDLELIDLNDFDILDINELDACILSSLSVDLYDKNYDFFSGLTGKGIYFLKRYAYTKDALPLTEIVAALEKLFLYDDNIGFFIRHYRENDTLKKEINYGLAHGLPGIISLLLMIYKEGIDTGKIKMMLSRLSAYMVNSAASVNNTAAYSYSDIFLRQHPDSLPIRHGWCYGDLGVAIVLLGTAKVLDDENLYDFAFTLAGNTLIRKDLKDCQVMDACICHGSSGLALMYRRLYEMTSDQSFRDAAAYWFEMTEKLCDHEEGINGYLYWKGDENDHYTYEKDYGFLEGAAGVCISRLIRSHPEKAKYFDWNKLLLLPNL